MTRSTNKPLTPSAVKQLKEAQPPAPAEAIPATSQAPLPFPRHGAKPQGKPPVAQTPAIPQKVDPLLLTILEWQRDHDSADELEFCEWLETHVKTVAPTRQCYWLDRAAFVVEVPHPGDGENKKSGLSDIMFACHVDTQAATRHCGEGRKQQLVYDANFGHIFLSNPDWGQVLGADDGVGVWILLCMIEKGIPGCYVFHRGEERGLIGARILRNKHEKFLRRFSVAVEFDRPGNDEVIITQGGQSCASVEFGKALANALNKNGDNLDFDTSTRGVCTDVKEYRSIIDEVVNIGVGYTGHHSKDETLDYAHAFALKEAVLRVDWMALPIHRDASKAAPPAPQYGGFRGYWGRVTDVDMDRWADSLWDEPPSAKAAPAPAPAPKAPEPAITVYEELAAATSREDIVAIMEAYGPDELASAFIDMLAELTATKARADMYATLAKGGY
jgi:hypothetical protein